MEAAKIPSAPLRVWPAETGIMLASIAALVCMALGWGTNRCPPLLAAAVSVFAGAQILLALRRQAAVELFAARLCIDNTAPPRRLSASLSLIAATLESLQHRTANINPVTGLPTREYLEAEIEGDIAADRGATLIGAIRFSDFDRLAAFDRAAADAALRNLAARLTRATKSHHVLAQIDRNCFCIWFRGERELRAAAAEFNALVYVAGRDIADGGAALRPTIEAASGHFPRDGGGAAQLFLFVTAALARPNGSAGGSAGGAAAAAVASVESAREDFLIEQDLTQAIAEDQLTMMFQPVVDLSVGRMIGAEALLRWNHPTLGSISPARFIPVVEAIGLSERYGLWVLNAACREARRCRDEGIDNLKLAVNLSARQLLDPTLCEKVQRTLDRHGLPANALELELTETAAMADADRTGSLFRQLRAMGVSLAIDDFGSGYSSLSYLKNLPFDKLKIDREFVIDVDKKRDSRAICKALIELGRGLGLLVLAEGVETAEEVAALRELGCTVFQGYHFSKPRSGEAFRALAHDPAWRSSLKQAALSETVRFESSSAA